MCALPPGLRKLLFSLACFLLSTTAAVAATKHVQVGDIFFRDVENGTSTTTINTGDTIVWDWVGGTHNTESGTCNGQSCAPDGLWVSPTMFSGSFSRTFNSAGVFPYYCAPHQPFMQGTVIVTDPADFTVAVSDADGGSMGAIFPGQQTAFDGTVVGSNGYSKTVTLSCQSGNPALPLPCTPNNPQNGTPTGVPTFNFTITAAANSTGHYSFSAQGTDGTLTHLFPNLNFDVVDFGIVAPSPASVTVFSNPASTATSSSASVSLTAVGILPDNVTLACDSNTLPAWVTSCNFQPVGPYAPTQGAPVNTDASVTVQANTPVQNSSVLLDATSGTNAGQVIKNQPLAVHVVQFNATAFPPAGVTIGAGNTSNPASTQLTVSGTFVNPVTATMACTAGLPAGGACSFPQTNGTVTSFPDNQQVMVSVPFNTPAGSPSVTVTATASSGGAVFTQMLPLTVHIPAPALSLSAPSPATVSMINNSFSGPISLQITPTNLAGVVTLSCSSGTPHAGVICHFLPSQTVNVNGGPVNAILIIEANGAATPSALTDISINANATINGSAVSSSVGLTELDISAPGTTTDVSLGVTAVNAVFNGTLINVGDPNLQITASVNNSGSTYSSATWEIGFSNPVVLVPASETNAACTQLLPTTVSCSLGDVSNGSSSHSFKVSPLSGRSLVITNWLTSPTVGDSNLANNAATAPIVQVRLRPLARRGLVPKTP